MSDYSWLPSLNAGLNATAALFLCAGFACIRTGRVGAHRACMLGAFTSSVLFLCSYLFYHWMHGSTPFAGTGWVRPFYFGLLLSHTVLAAVVVPLALTALWRAARGDFQAHRRVARWALPIWLYVSVTGVTVYWMLYHGYRTA
ncbi:MAG: DUF420 domain-containing protein [Candidatus Wallbacteria bacterium]|nr:DUF420 domain-containing protein [Candidatus Wallbacteria bacterium]